MYAFLRPSADGIIRETVGGWEKRNIHARYGKMKLKRSAFNTDVVRVIRDECITLSRPTVFRYTRKKKKKK